MRIKTIIVSLIALNTIFAVSVFMAAGEAKAETDKQYRSGQIISISGKNYLIANNKEFAEIIEITPSNQLYQASEVHGPDKIEDVQTGYFMDKPYLVAATGQFLYKYDISNPRAPKIEFRRDLYVFRRGYFRNGSVNGLAGNKDFIFGAGPNGVRSFFPDNLFVDKIYTFDKAYGIAADDDFLYVITETKGQIYDIFSGVKLAEINLENKNKQPRSPSFDSSGNIYFPDDQGLVKIDGASGRIKFYTNPVPATDIFSYGLSALPDGTIYYANGHGITVLNADFNKTNFLNTSKSSFGANSWAVGAAAARVGGRDAVLALNKSSILLLDKNLKVLARYKYRKLYPDYISTDLKIVPSVNLASAGRKINLRVFGYWPNETVTIAFGKKIISAKTDNQGFVSVDLTVPRQKQRQTIIQVTGDDSKLNYQTTFTVL
ncbi:MAG: hypothetical protein Q8O93_01645 [bacterium]|nr:hypothetical protein [bacterium]